MVFCAKADSKEIFLKAECLNTFFDDQVEVHIFGVMRDAKLGYLKSCIIIEKESVMAALHLTGRLFLETHKYWKTLSKERLIMLNELVLMAIKDTHTTKAKPYPIPRLSK